MPKMNNDRIRKISLMGSTGSIGVQTIDVVRQHPERFKISALTANTNWELLAQQARELNPELVVIADPAYYARLNEALRDTDINVASGEEALKAAATLEDTDIVVGALVGYSGLPSVLEALKAGKQVALANKETLVVAGAIIKRLIENGAKPILPIDSEHSAIFQCLAGESREAVSKIILTASGGPFRTLPADELENVTIAQTLSHPNWNMGTKVTVDSATMMNKGFEMMEACWLFDASPSEIEVVVHPQSIVHSMVEFRDRSIKAQLGIPDMRIPISYALGYPDRIANPDNESLDVTKCGPLEFFSPDYEKFPLLKAAYQAMEAGGTLPAVMNAANEVAVEAFVNGKIPFTSISTIVLKTMERAQTSKEVTIETIKQSHIEGTQIASSLI